MQVAASDDVTLSDEELDRKLQEFGEYDPTLDLSSYEPPPSTCWWTTAAASSP